MADRLALDLVSTTGSSGRPAGEHGVALVALFLRRPDILLLDEPTNNLT